MILKPPYVPHDQKACVRVQHMLACDEISWKWSPAFPNLRRLVCTLPVRSVNWGSIFSHLRNWLRLPWGKDRYSKTGRVLVVRECQIWATSPLQKAVEYLPIISLLLFLGRTQRVSHRCHHFYSLQISRLDLLLHSQDQACLELVMPISRERTYL